MATDGDCILLKALGDYFVVHWIGLASMAGGHFVLRWSRMQKFATSRAGKFVHRVTHGFKLHPVKCREVVFILQKKIHVAFVHAVIDSRLDVENVEVFVNQFSQACTFAI